MEIAVAENAQLPAMSSGDGDHLPEDPAPHNSNDEDTEPKYNFTSEEARDIMEVIAATGKFWHDWNMLKNVLSFRLKQVWGEYSESQMGSDAGSQKSSLSSETYSDLVKSLDEALLSFMEGPPFTLQRLCEILLDPKSTYTSLSKLALALEKNLLVTSTLSVCTEPYPTEMMQKLAVTDSRSDELPSQSSPVHNGSETLAGDGDEEMVEADSNEDAANTTTDTEMQEDNGRLTAVENSEPSESTS